MVSSISCGTERANITGNPNVVATEAAGNVTFPRTVGYSSAGIVVRTGNDVVTIKEGDRVVVYWGKHREYNVVPEHQVVKIEDERISFETAAISFIASFPMAAIRKTRLEMGESAMVMGLGTLGMIAVKLLRLAGAVPIIAVDPDMERRKLALKNGADVVLDLFADGFSEKAKSITGGGAKVAIEVTGAGKRFSNHGTV